RFFPFGAFGSDSELREDLPPIAARRASAANGHRFVREDIVVIGDSIFDVRCGVPHQSRTIAVATGVTPAELLRAENPHYFFETLERTEDVVTAILD
ncbi:MAG TPA: HAD hydrolase-like protein, partial [Thermoanaerobaculia bacterium]|nr:HAD hydrolase-like protein [Thermoanaerobaculia bacterium]